MEHHFFKASGPPALVCCSFEGFPIAGLSVRSLLYFLGLNHVPGATLPSEGMLVALPPLSTHTGPKEEEYFEPCFSVSSGCN